jgi:hypothetical protein
MEDLLEKKQARSAQIQSIGFGSMSHNLMPMEMGLIEAAQSGKAL